MLKDNPNFKNYVRNYEMGFVKPLFKNKDYIKKQVTGIIDITVKNPDGSISQQSHSENLINDEAIFNIMYLQFLNSQAMGSSLINGTNFGRIFLTDWNQAEDATLKEIQGNVIGYADVHKLYAGNNAKQGTFVPASSSITPSSFVFVAEFGSAISNGTFQTVWFASSPPVSDSDLNSAEGKGYATKRIELVDGTLPNTNGAIAFKQGQIFNFGATSVAVFDITDVGLQKSLVADTNLSYSIPTMPHRACYISATNEFWCSALTNDGVIVLDANLNQTGDIFPPDTTSASPVIAGGIRNLAEGKNGKVYMNVQGYKDIFITDAVGRSLDGKYTFNELIGTIWNITSTADKEYLIAQLTASDNSYFAEAVFKINDDNTLTLLCQNEVTEQFDRCPVDMWGAGFFISTAPNLYRSFTTPGSQTLLASPITKNPGQTLTLKYTFNFQ